MNCTTCRTKEEPSTRKDRGSRINFHVSECEQREQEETEERSPWEASASSSSSSSSCSSQLPPQLFSSSSFFLCLKAAPVRNWREESTCSPDAPASTGRPRVGRQSPQCRRLRSLLCSPVSAGMLGRSPRGGVFCAREP